MCLQVLHMMLVEAVQRWAMPAEGTRGNGGLVALHNGTFVPWHRVRGEIRHPLPRHAMRRALLLLLLLL